MITRTASDRLARYVVRGSESDCWSWSGPANQDGYGVVTVAGKSVNAHRYAWELASGPIPSGMFVCHRCDNPPCCNPAHLFLGTLQDNSEDMRKKGRAARGDRNGTRLYPERRAWGERSPHAKLTEENVREIRARLRDGASERAVAGMFGVHRGTIHRIKHRVRWSFLDSDWPAVAARKGE